MNTLRLGVAALVVALMLAGTAQTSPAQSRTLGVKGGVTLASADLGDLGATFDANNRTGWGVGAFLTLGGGVFSIQPELNLIEIGFEATSPLMSPEVKLRYLAPAVLLKLGIPLGIVKPSLFGGVGVGIELQCRFDGIDCADAPFPLETSTSDPTGIFGLDVDIFPGRTLALRGDVRYTVGLDDIRKASDIWSKIKNRAWQFSAGVGYRF